VVNLVPWVFPGLGGPPPSQGKDPGNEVVARYPQPWTKCVGKCQKQEIIIVIPTE